MDKNYIVSSAEDKGEAQFGAHRYMVKFETGEQASMFSKFALKVGDTVFGHLEEITKGDKTYINFKFAKKDAPPRELGTQTNAELKNLINFGVLPKLTEILAKLDRLETLLDVDGVAPRDKDGIPF